MVNKTKKKQTTQKAKRTRIYHENDHGEEDSDINILSDFKTSAVLNDSAREKTIFIHGKLADQNAVVILEKIPFRENTLPDLLTASKLKLDMKNDIYSTYKLQAPPHLNEIKTTVVCPATENHVRKYQRNESFLVEETGEDYRSITLPYIQEQSSSMRVSAVKPECWFHSPARFPMGQETVPQRAKSKRVKSKRLDHEHNLGEEESDTNILSDFKTSAVLNKSARDKTIFIHGKFADQNAVVTLEKTPFRENTLPELLTASKLTLDMKNDIYSTYKLQAPPHLNEIKTTVVCPATENHVRKYQRNYIFLVEETGEDYRSITLPYIQEHSFSLEWVYNILEKKAESERIVFEDPDQDVGFVLLPDFKWDQKQTEDLHLIAIAHPKDIKSLRDLRSEHLPLLQNISQRGKEVILERYNIPHSKLRVFLHYQPSYYHLHVHFTKLDYDMPGCTVERTHLLSDVIYNLQSDKHYYKTRTLHFPLRSHDRLLSKFKEAGRI